jgi:hypothetical protein
VRERGDLPPRENLRVRRILDDDLDWIWIFPPRVEIARSNRIDVAGQIDVDRRRSSESSAKVLDLTSEWFERREGVPFG